MDLFMPAERVLYDRAYYLSDEAERDYAFEAASAAKKAAGCSGGDGAGDAGAIKL